MENEAMTERPSEKGALHEKKRDFSGTKLGFMRFVMFAYGFVVIWSIVGLMLASRDKITYDLGTIMLFFDVVFAGMSVWLLVKRMHAAIPFIIGSNAVDIAIEAVYLVTGRHSFDDVYVTIVISSLLIVYFVTSRRAKAVLVNTFSDETVQDKGIPSMRDPLFWRNLVLFYCLFSILGHWMEAGFCMLIRMGVVAGSYDPSNTSLWRDWLYPFPPDGVGFVMCVLILYPFKNWVQEKIHTKWLAIIPSFVVNALVCTLVELSFGFVVNANHQLWDYSNMFCNFMGQVCLQNSIGFGIASTLATWAIYPFLVRQINRLPKKRMTFLFVAFVTFYAMLQALYLINLAVPGLEVTV